MAESIGIKQANGGFYSILEERSAVKKRMVLTTVYDNQKSVQIDLYKSVTRTMADAVHIGSLVMENLSPAQKGQPSIEMILSSNGNGSIAASAVDLGNPSNEHRLDVSLRSFANDKEEYPDFEIDDKKFEDAEKERKIPWLLIIVIGLVLVLLCFGLWFFLRWNKKNGSGQAAVSFRTERPSVQFNVPEAILPGGVTRTIR
jgi:ATP-dependent Zn protease